MKKFKTKGKRYTLIINPDAASGDPWGDLNGAISNVIQTAFVDANPKAMVGLELRHEAMDKPILIPFSTRDALNTEKVLGILEAVIQSNQVSSYV